MIGLISCQSPASSNSTSAAPASTGGSATLRAEVHPTIGPARDLRQDEAAGGHILRKHVGQTEEQLRQRLERERNITGASTYTDRSTAEHAVGAAIAQSQSEIQNWLSRPGRHPNLVLDYDSEDPVGRTMNRGEVHSRPCTHALVVLKYSGANHYYVLTSYPECRS
jgi:toxin YxiD